MKRSIVTLLDMKGLIMHSYYRGNDSNPLVDREGNKANTARHAIKVFLDTYWTEAVETSGTYGIVAVWDGGYEYRKRLYPEYKSHREEAKAKEKTPVQKMQEEQLDLAYKVAKAMIAYSGGINIHVPTVEADDVIGLLAYRLPNRNICIFTVDNDLIQLARNTESKTVTVKVKDNWVAEYETETGTMIPPRYIPITKALIGDKSDGYKGVHGFGPAALDFFLNNYGYEGLDELEKCIKGKDFSFLQEAAQDNNCKVLNRIFDARASLSMCYNLAILHPEICWGFSGVKQIKPNYYKRIPSEEKLRNILSSVSCNWLYEEKFKPYMPTYRLVTKENFSEAMKELRVAADRSPLLTYDHETYDSLQHPGFLEALPKSKRGKGYIDTLSHRLCGTSVCFGESAELTYYFSFNHRDTDNLSLEQAEELFELLYSLDAPKVAHNAGFEIQVLHSHFNKWYGPTQDTMELSSYFDENLDRGLKDLSASQFGYEQTTFSQVLESVPEAKDMRDLSGMEVLNYGCDDSFVTAHLYQQFFLGICMEGCWSFFEENCILPVQSYAQSFEAGCNIDGKKVEELTEKDAKRVNENTDRIKELLIQHCSTPDPEKINGYFEAERDFILHQLTVSNPDATRYKLLSLLEERKLKLIPKTAYVPLEQINHEPEFIPTPTKLSEVATALGLPSPKLEKNSNKGVTQWLALNGLTGKPVQSVSQEQKTFADLLVAAVNAKAIKSRTGDEYQALEAFCKQYLTGKVETVGDALNFGSPIQMQELLYLKLGLPVRVRNDTERGSERDKAGLLGSPSTNEEAIMSAKSADCPDGDWRREVLDAILEVKNAMTRFQLYWNPYPHWTHPRDGMIHPGIKSSATATRRPAGTSPNILQVEKGEVRSIFLPRLLGKQIIVCIDFNGQELRLTGSEAKDPVMIECYNGGGTWTDEDGMVHPRFKDIHSVTGTGFALPVLEREGLGSLAGRVLNFDRMGNLSYDQFYSIVKDKPLDVDISEAEMELLSNAIGKVRSYAKVVNFLLIYGGNEFTLAQKLGLPETFCSHLMKSVFIRYPRLQGWQEETQQFAETFGYTVTAFGTRRHLDEKVRSRDSGTRNRMLRQAVNATIQGCAAEILKKVQSEVVKTRLMEETKSVIHAPVYDEIFASVSIDHVFEYVDRLQDIMNFAPPGHPIPMVGEVGIGLNWAQCKKVELGDRPSERKLISAIEKMIKEAA